MINFRFHIVSLIGIFLALALGIVIGAGVIDRGIVDTLDNRLDNVEAQGRPHPARERRPERDRRARQTRPSRRCSPMCSSGASPASRSRSSRCAGSTTIASPTRSSRPGRPVPRSPVCCGSSRSGGTGVTTPRRSQLWSATRACGAPSCGPRRGTWSRADWLRQPRSRRRPIHSPSSSRAGFVAYDEVDGGVALSAFPGRNALVRARDRHERRRGEREPRHARGHRVLRRRPRSHHCRRVRRSRARARRGDVFSDLPRQRALAARSPPSTTSTSRRDRSR